MTADDAPVQTITDGPETEAALPELGGVPPAARSDEDPGPRLSRLGLISLILSLTAALIVGGAVAYAFVNVLQGDPSSFLPDAIVAALFAFGTSIASLALGLGIGALFQSHRAKTLAVVGSSVSALVFLAIVGTWTVALFLYAAPAPR